MLLELFFGGNFCNGLTDNFSEIREIGQTVQSEAKIYQYPNSF